MITIHKFQVPDDCSIDMPQGSIIVHVKEQNNIPTIWALVDTDRAMISRHFRVYNTGEEITSAIELTYVGTAHCHAISDTEIQLVRHIFEIL